MLCCHQPCSVLHCLWPQWEGKEDTQMLLQCSCNMNSQNILTWTRLPGGTQHLWPFCRNSMMGIVKVLSMRDLWKWVPAALSSHSPLLQLMFCCNCVGKYRKHIYGPTMAFCTNLWNCHRVCVPRGHVHFMELHFISLRYSTLHYIWQTFLFKVIHHQGHSHSIHHLQIQNAPEIYKTISTNAKQV